MIGAGRISRYTRPHSKNATFGNVYFLKFDTKFDFESIELAQWVLCLINKVKNRGKFLFIFSHSLLGGRVYRLIHYDCMGSFKTSLPRIPWGVMWQLLTACKLSRSPITTLPQLTSNQKSLTFCVQF
jgi:hypothetical protein